MPTKEERIETLKSLTEKMKDVHIADLFTDEVKEMFRDACLYGYCVLVDGKRVPPTEIWNDGD